MAQMSLNTYIHTPARIFHLNGRCWSCEQGKGVPCRIKVGPRRWLTENVIPEELSVTIWQEQGDGITYLPNEPVQTSVDPNGILTLDMVTFAREYFGKDNVSFCSSDTWKWNKHGASSNIFLMTDRGFAASSASWLDISIYHSDLFVAPGTLKLCGQDVRHIYWETFCEDLTASGEAIRPMVEAIFSGTHSISAENLRRCLEKLEAMQNGGFNHMVICTERGRFDLHNGLDQYLCVELKDEGDVLKNYAPYRMNGAMKDIEILLQMLEASDGEAIQRKAKDFLNEGLLIKRTRR